jgi:hypothetical protein
MRLILVALLSVMTFSVMAQRDFTPGKNRSTVFGKADYKNYRYFGLQFSAGPTFMKTRAEKNNITYNTVDATGRPMDYTIDPEGKVGVFAEVGLAHFPKKRSKISLALKTVLVSYYDWGLGFKLLGGTETTSINYYNSLGALTSSDEGKGSYYNGYLYGRFTLHKNINLSKKYFIDNGLGINFDFRLIDGNKSYDGPYVGSQYFHEPLVAQLQLFHPGCSITDPWIE